MSTIGERIDEARRARGLTKQKLEELCDFSKGYASRLIKDERGTENPTAATLAKLCDKLAINAAWLERGEGPRDVGAAPPARTVERDDRYPSRPAAARAAREIGVHEDAVVAVLAWQLDADDDPGAGWWLDQMRGEADRMRFARRGGTSGDPADVSAAKAAASKPKLPKRRT